ncbi:MULTISPECIES: alpha-L-fucosidase [Lelliottia]|uniref:alpha-L-fucosidase n=1 Tax=Lelliottia TaxID=1330545 RepID=UPI0009E6A5EA|nr:MULTISPECIES: alpha-L-fucosidase [Lelliottia]ATG01596.1 hypothetical protein CO697_08355 [Lelliottia amnigena]PEG66233.1 hypothetical protein CRH15_02110 [Lelliottia amnigena]QXA21912.1 alpha-L-fucosidase [Lelliottia amnigena]CAI9401197.1 hypothetical protein CCAJJPOJ_00571 [Lelliottia sp. T2.26D-8]
MSNDILYFQNYIESNVVPEIIDVDNYSTTDYDGVPLNPSQQSVVKLPVGAWLKFRTKIPLGRNSTCMIYASTTSDNQKIDISIGSISNDPLWRITATKVGVENYFIDNYSNTIDFNTESEQDVYFNFPSGFNGCLNWFVFCQYSNTEANEEKLRRMSWFTESKFGHMIHWGAYSVLARGEWVMNTEKIPKDEYIQQACIPFDPKNYDPDYWSDIILGAGQKYVTITTKHHDGFAMFNTNVKDFAPYDVVNTASAHRSVLKPFASACHSKGIKFCCYYSLLDWGNKWEVAIENANSLDPENINPDDVTRYLSEMKEHLKELIEIFDPVLIWFDGAWAAFINDEVSQGIAKYLHCLSPDIIINDRIGNGYGDYATPEKSIPAGTSTGLWETCMTINNSWGYNSNDQNWKSTQTLLNELLDCASKGGNFLLNTGPTADGIIPQPCVDRLDQIGKWLSKWGQAVYQTRAGTLDVSYQPGCFCTVDKNNILYVTLTERSQDDQIRIDAPQVLPVRCYWLNNPSSSLTYTIIDGLMVFSLLEGPSDDLGIVLAMEFEELPQPKNYPDKALMKHATANNVWNNDIKEYGPQFMVDGNEATRWASSITPVIVEVDLGSVQTLTRIGFRQYETRINQFVIDAYIDDAWQPVITSSSPAAYYIGYLDTPIRATKIRLTINSVFDDNNSSIYTLFALNANETLLPVNIPINLAKGSSASATDVWYDKEDQYGPLFAIDGNQTTRWAANANPPLPIELTFNFIRETTFDLVLISEYLTSQETISRISNFSLEVFSEEHGWVEIFNGNDISVPISLPYLTKGESIKLIINDVIDQSGPSIYEFSVWQTARNQHAPLDDEEILELESRSCFEYFWREANLTPGASGYGLISDTTNSRRATIANTGFGLSSFVIAAERGWIDFDLAQQRCQLSLVSLLNTVPQVNGFFYHFIDMDTLDTEGSNVSTVDTMLALNGILTAGQYFGGECGALAQQIFDRVNWQSAVSPDGYFTMSIAPNGDLSPSNWGGYAEQFCMYPMALGSTTFAPKEGASLFYNLGFQHGNYKNNTDVIYVFDGALFAYQFSHAWIDFRKCKDRNGIDWWQNSVNATEANYQFCLDYHDILPSLDNLNWGLTACNGPSGYGVYGAPPSGWSNANNVHYTDGTVTPSGPLGSLPFTPDKVMASVRAWYNTPSLWTSYGFSEAYNTSTASIFYCPKNSGLTKGITILMIENYRSRLIWDTYMSHPVLKRGLPVIFDNP